MPALSTFNYNVLSVLAAQLGLKPVWSLASGDAASDVDDWLAYALSDAVQSSQLVALRQQVKTAIGSNVTPDAKRMFEYYRAILDSNVERLIASRLSVPTNTQNGLLSMMSRLGSFARDDISSIKLAWTNWIADGSMVNIAGNVLSVAASIEYPAGTFTQIKFGGASTGSA